MTDSTIERTFTERELQQYDGRRGKPVYIAYDGIVYDVTNAALWRTGQHQDLHFSGVDLTRSLQKAPHSAEVFTRPGVRPIGRLVTG